ncbi:PEFG-CTERM sorting domain-containing protein [Nitrosopumilus sp. S4]
MKPVIIILMAFVLLIPTTVFAQTYSYEPSDECPDPEFPYLWENGKCHKTSEYDYNCNVGFEEYWNDECYLDNGCPVDYPNLWEDGLCYDLPEPKPAIMGFYENERYEFSFEIPTNWRYQEGITTEDGRTYELLAFPEEFSLENVDDDANMMDLQMALSGLPFQFESPLIAVNFENIPTSKVSTLSEKNLKEYVLDKIMIEQPSAKIMDSWVKSNSWGWEVYVIYNYDLDMGIDKGIPYMGEESTYFFKDRESYVVEYGAPPIHFDEYRHVYDHVLETLIIKSVAVPEFGSIAILILITSVVSIIVVSRKFTPRI